MPPRARAEKSVEKPAAKQQPDDDAETKPAKEDEICRRCWPAGWPWPAANASCVHGTWKRDQPDPPPSYSY